MSATMPKWEEKYEWKARGRNFLVTVECRDCPTLWGARNPWRWNVYAYVYPGHPRFDKIGTPIDPLAAPRGCEDLHFHGGILGAVTFFMAHFDANGAITSYQLGSDYDHANDDWARSLEPRYGKNSEVFLDAEKLFLQLTADWEAAK